METRSFIATKRNTFANECNTDCAYSQKYCAFFTLNIFFINRIWRVWASVYIPDNKRQTPNTVTEELAVVYREITTSIIVLK